jgi:hypothetical protein
MPDAISEKSELDPAEEFKAWVKAFKEKLNSPSSDVSIEIVSSEARPPNRMQEDQHVLKETAENGFLNEMLRQAQELETRARAYAESYPEPPGKLSARVEQLENEIVELKNENAARNATIKELEQRIAQLEGAH